MLRGMDYGDHHRILSFLTLEHGKIDLIALGAKKSIKRFAGVLDFLNCVEIGYRLNSKGGLGRLEQIELRESFDPVRQDYHATMVVLHWNQLLFRSLQVGQKIFEIFELLHDAMHRLSEYSPDTVDLFFRRHLLSRLGYHLELSRCVHCQRNDRTGYRFSPEKGGLECTLCLPYSGGKVLKQPVSDDFSEVNTNDHYFLENTPILRKILDESFSYFLGV
jgi:DNA repair protein RecO (recombination protein O)